MQFLIWTLLPYTLAFILLKWAYQENFLIAWIIFILGNLLGYFEVVTHLK